MGWHTNQTFEAAPYIAAASSPGVNNDGVDTAGLGRAFTVGDQWIRSDTGQEWACTSAATGAAVWRLSAFAGAAPAAGSVAPGNSTGAGSAGTVALSDHVHPITCAPGAALTEASSVGEGSATTFARADHTHSLVSATPPEVDLLDFSAAAGIAMAGGDIVLGGRNLLQGQAFDGLTRSQVGGASIALAPLKPGASGITVQIVAGAGALGIAYDSGTRALIITLAAGGSTDDAIATAINANGAQTDGHVRCASGSGGAFTLAQASAPMTGGAGNYAGNQVLVGGIEALPANTPGTAGAAAWATTSIKCTTAASSISDAVQIVVQSNGLRSRPLTGLVEVSGGAWLTWIPTITCKASMTITGATVVEARYVLFGKTCHMYLQFYGTLVTPATNEVRATLPSGVVAVGARQLHVNAQNGDGTVLASAVVNPTTNLVFNVSGAGSNWTLGAGFGIWAEITFEIA